MDGTNCFGLTYAHMLKVSGPTSDPQLCVLILVLVVSDTDYDLTTNWMFMHECHLYCMTK